MDANTLVQLLVATALVDQSAPPCWRMNELLGAVERLVLVTLGDCAGYAKIAGLALAELGEKTVNPAVKVLLKLAVLNGRRRCDDEDALTIQNLFDKAREEILQLEEGPRRDRCWSFFLYQQQVFGARCGFYGQASRAAEAAASLNTEPHTRAISMYLARVYAMWAAVLSGEQEDITTAFNALKQELQVLQNAVSGTALEVQWGMGNGPIHLMQAMMLSPMTDKGLWDNCMAVVVDNEGALGGAFKPWIDILKAHDLHLRAEHHPAVAAAHAIVDDPRSSQTTKAWGTLILARALGMIEPNASKSAYEAIVPVPDAHMVAAVARREIVQWTPDPLNP